MTAVLQFPRFRAYRREPDAVRLAYDFNDWCAGLRSGEKLSRRIRCASREEAQAEVARQEAAGLRRLPDAQPDETASKAPGEIMIWPDPEGGGCWRIDHVSASGGSAAIVGNAFDFGEAVTIARDASARLGATFDDSFSNFGGAA